MRHDYTVGLATLGCKVAQYETEALAEAFESLGFTVLSFEDICDVYVINTCTVTAESDRKSRQMIRRASRRNEKALVMVTGCYAQTSPNEVAQLPQVVYVSGNESKLNLPKKALAFLTDGLQETPTVEGLDLDGAPFEPMSITRAPRTRAYVKIEDGCDCRCTYCAIPGARGPVRSKPQSDVLREIDGLVQGGTREIVLTGIETASYGRDFGDGSALVALIEQIAAECDVSRIRLGSMTPEFFTEERVERLASIGVLTPHFHLSVQSASGGVLARMRRRYQPDRLYRALALLRTHFATLELSGDFICGFPGETDAEFEETYAFAEQAEFLQMHVFTYSKRKNTPAATFEGQVSKEIAAKRSARLIALGERMKEKRLRRALGYGRLRVLFEQREGDCFIGHTEHFLPVAIRTDRDLHGMLLDTVPLCTDGGRISATLV